MMSPYSYSKLPMRQHGVIRVDVMGGFVEHEYMSYVSEPTVELGSRWRLARAVRADCGVTLRAGRRVYVGGYALGTGTSQGASSSGLPAISVRTGDFCHVASVLEVDLRPD